MNQINTKKIVKQSIFIFISLFLLTIMILGLMQVFGVPFGKQDASKYLNYYVKAQYGSEYKVDKISYNLFEMSYTGYMYRTDDQSDRPQSIATLVYYADTKAIHDGNYKNQELEALTASLNEVTKNLSTGIQSYSTQTTAYFSAKKYKEAPVPFYKIRLYGLANPLPSSSKADTKNIFAQSAYEILQGISETYNVDQCHMLFHDNTGTYELKVDSSFRKMTKSSMKNKISFISKAAASNANTSSAASAS